MKERKKLTASEKKELKARLKKSVWTAIHVVSYILSAIAVILIAIGCSQSGNQKANAQSVVTTPIPSQPNRANLVNFRADDYYKTLPSDYVVSVSLPNYQDIANYLPSYSLFNYYFESLINVDTWAIYEAQVITLDEVIEVDEYSYHYIGIYITDNYVYYSLFMDTNVDDRLDILGVSSNNVYTLSFSDYEQIKAQNISYHINADIYSFDDDSVIVGTYPQFINRFYWWFLSSDTYRQTIALDTYNVLNAVAYLGLNTYQDNAIVYSSEPLSSVDMLVGNIYYNGLLFTRAVYNFSPIYKGSNSELRILVGGSYVANSNSIQNAQIFALCNDSSYANYYYLESVTLRVNNNELKIFEVVKHIRDSESGSIFDDFFSVHDIYVSYHSNAVESTQYTNVYTAVNLYFLSFLPNFKTNTYLLKYAPTTIVGVFSGYILPSINIDTGTNTTDMFSQVFEWITFTFYGLSTILSFQIVQGVSLGLLLLIPFLFTIILFIVKLFKR